jgi:hypothetical protein
VANPIAGANASQLNATSSDDVEGEIERKCAVPRVGIRIGLVVFALLIVGLPVGYCVMNRRSIIDTVCDNQFKEIDVDGSNSINVDEFYIAVLQIYLKVYFCHPPPSHAPLPPTTHPATHSYPATRPSISPSLRHMLHTLAGT